jgi:phosphoribosylanthranilate isomerase
MSEWVKTESTISAGELRTRIKFCGMTREQDVLDAAALGADAVGFNCFPGSKRYIEPARVGALAAVVPAFVTPVLLFVNAPVTAIRAALDVVPLAVLQFHGGESAEFCRSFGRPYLRAINIDGPQAWQHSETMYADAMALLADTPTAGHGGSGTTFDWSRLPLRAARHARLVLAGGLRADNVGAAIAATRPFAVDVSSGIEEAPGWKSAAKMREFAAAVQAADLALNER